MDVRTTKPARLSGTNLRAPLTALGILLASIVCIVFFGGQFDRPITSLINRAARQSGPVDLCFLLFAGQKALFSGAILLGMVWCLVRSGHRSTVEGAIAPGYVDSVRRWRGEPGVATGAADASTSAA
jgi:hypothetical protein